MDLSSVIFGALVIAWALYLIPKALSRHDEMAKTRSLDSFSGRLRVLGRPSRRADVSWPGAPAADTAAASVAASRPALPTRESARKAARRRRRVLGALLVVAVGVGAASYLGRLPVWAAAVPGALIVVFLVIARLTVRSEAQARAAIILAPDHDTEETVDVPVPVAPQRKAESERLEVEPPSAPAPEPVLEDDGALWDPLPMTLPTYVGKAPAARRTVRTIELTGVTSSGHDSSDSALAARADAERRADSAESDAGSDAGSGVRSASADRKAAGA